MVDFVKKTMESIKLFSKLQRKCKVMKKFRKLTAIALSAAAALMVGTTSSFAVENGTSKETFALAHSR